MTDAEKDPVLRRAVEELQKLPDANADRVRQVVLAAAAARVSAAADDVLVEPPRRSRAARVWAAASLLTAAAIVGFVARGAWTPASPSAPVVATPTTVGPTRAVSASASDVLPLPQQFSFVNTTAHRVAVIGDFNEWNPIKAPLTRSADGSLWSAIVPILPGRHLYGFMVDDTLFVLDPRAPKALDPDFGSQGSVLIVGRP